MNRMKKFKHKITGDIVENNSVSDFYHLEGKSSYKSIPKEWVENSSDWEEIKDEYPKIVAIKSDHPSEKGVIITYNGEHSISRSDGRTCPTIELSMALKESFVTIYQVATSPIELFTVGDRVRWSGAPPQKTMTIDRFSLSPRNGGILVHFIEDLHYKDGFRLDLLNKYENLGQPVFIAKDDKAIFKGDKYWYCPSIKNISNWSENLLIQSDICRTLNPSINKNLLFFGAKEAAEKYIEENRPRFSKKQIEEAILKSKFEKQLTMNVTQFKQNLGI